MSVRTHVTIFLAETVAFMVIVAWILRHKNGHIWKALSTHRYLVGVLEVCAHLPEPPVPPLPLSMICVQWNIGWAYGEGYDGGSSYVQQHKTWFEDNLTAIASVIVDTQADLVCLTEVDFSSSRSYNLDQAKILAQKTGLKYYTCVVEWINNNLVYSTQNIRRLYGQVNVGGVILSRYPLENTHIVYLPYGKSWHTRLFAFIFQEFFNMYYCQSVVVRTEHQNIHVMNLHCEPKDQAGRARQIKHWGDWLTRCHKENVEVDVVMGDFGMVPSYTASHEEKQPADTTYDLLVNTLTPLNLRSILDAPDGPAGAQERYARAPHQWHPTPPSSPAQRTHHLFYNDKRWHLASACVWPVGEDGVLNAAQAVAYGRFCGHLPTVARIVSKNPLPSKKGEEVATTLE